MGHQPRLLGDEAPEILVDLHRIDGGEAQPRQLGQLAQQAAHHLAQRRAARQIAAIAADVDAGQHDLLDARLHQPAGLGQDLAHGKAAVVAAAIGDDAEGAAVIAALLDLQEGAGAAFDGLDRAAPRSSSPS